MALSKWLRIYWLVQIEPSLLLFLGVDLRLLSPLMSCASTGLSVLWNLKVSRCCWTWMTEQHGMSAGPFTCHQKLGVGRALGLSEGHSAHPIPHHPWYGRPGLPVPTQLRYLSKINHLVGHVYLLKTLNTILADILFHSSSFLAKAFISLGFIWTVFCASVLYTCMYWGDGFMKSVTSLLNQIPAEGASRDRQSTHRPSAALTLPRSNLFCTRLTQLQSLLMPWAPSVVAKN